MTDAATLPPQRRLGRGLSALLGGGAPACEETHQEVHSELRQIPTTLITRNPFQPRKQFDPEGLGELASSIREHGILQPLIVREADGGFQLIAGERRWLAAQKAGLTSVPCRVMDVIDKTACEFALEENLKRKDLNDLEKAQAFRDYLDQFECTIEELGKQLSMNRSTVSNMLRLLELPDPIKHALHSGRITAGHARSLLPLDVAQQLELCSRIQAEQLSVRQTEAAVRKLLGRDDAPAEATPTDASLPQAAPAEGIPHAEIPAMEQHQEHAQEGSPVHEQQDQPETIPLSEGDAARTHHVESLEAQLRDLLGVPVQIRLNSRESGQIVVPFVNNDEFERILGILRRHAA